MSAQTRRKAVASDHWPRRGQMAVSILSKKSSRRACGRGGMHSRFCVLFQRRSGPGLLFLSLPLAPREIFHAVVVGAALRRSEEHTSELQSHSDLVCRLL